MTRYVCSMKYRCSHRRRYELKLTKCTDNGLTRCVKGEGERRNM